MRGLSQFLCLVTLFAFANAQIGFSGRVSVPGILPFKASVNAHAVIPESIDQKLVAAFNEWKTLYNKVYATPGEEAVRRMIFGMNLLKIESHNADPSKTFEMKANFFADMTEGEFSMILGTRNMTDAGASPVKDDEAVDESITGKSAPSGDIDYEKDPCIGPVEHQQSCGSCYAFSAAHVAAWHHCKKNGNKYVNFSKQQIVDCSARDNGCTNGWTSTASNYIATYGIAAEEDYPYESKANKCKGERVRSAKLYKPISGTMRIAKNNEEAMKAALAEHGPLQVIIDGISLAFYSSGVISGSACEHSTVNHAIVLVGYKSDGGKGHWRVKNHWGPEWGENGYFNVEAFSPVNEGCLGIAAFPSYAY